MKRIFPVFLLSLIVFGVSNSFAAEPPFPNSVISSDFGPRSEGSFFHGGLDYVETAGTSIPSIEGGTIVFVRGNDNDDAGWRMAIQGTVTGRVFIYMHMFDNTASSGTVSGNFKLGKNDSTGEYFIKRISDGIVLKAGTAVAARDLIGPVGDSGTAAGHPHLHLQVGTNVGHDLDNPFMYVDHDASNFVVAPVNPPYSGYVIRSTEVANYAFKFRIDSTAGLDHITEDLPPVSSAERQEEAAKKAAEFYRRVTDKLKPDEERQYKGIYNNSPENRWKNNDFYRPRENRP